VHVNSVDDQNINETNMMQQLFRAAKSFMAVCFRSSAGVTLIVNTYYQGH